MKLVINDDVDNVGGGNLCGMETAVIFNFMPTIMMSS